MGLSALGIRHVLPLTGDPAKSWRPSRAKSVYDVTSVQLIEIITRLNEGFNHSGKSVKTPTRFVTGCTFNPTLNSSTRRSPAWNASSPPGRSTS